MDEGAWKAAVHRVAEGRTRLSDFTFTFHFHALEKEMATHCSVLAWRIPGTGEPGGLPFMGSNIVGHDWNDLAVAVASVHILVLQSISCMNLVKLVEISKPVFVISEKRSDNLYQGSRETRLVIYGSVLGAEQICNEF